MPSPFLLLPSSAWVASNALAFAIRDRFPVSPGHTLIIPRREVATWFDATPAEHAAILDLLTTVKTALDAELHPAGYNVGFNAGAAAGQTVFHLHLHVIPRYLGDRPDPRGGIRHVLPERANYLASPRPPSLSTGGAHDPFLAHLAPLFSTATSLSIVAAFVQDSGLEVLQAPLRSALARGCTIRLITGDYLAITQKAALQRLLDWETEQALLQEERPLQKGRFHARIVEAQHFRGGPRAFHPKSWRFEGGGTDVAFVGSSNVSRSALQGGIEWNLRVDRHRDPGAYAEVVTAFDRLWADAQPLTQPWVDAYVQRAREAALPLPTGEADPEPVTPVPAPHPIQAAALEALARARREHRRKALVVLATGLGKTWLAAFDVRAVQAELGRWPKVLFLAHRVELLTQAADRLRQLTAEQHPDARFGWCVGAEGALEADVLLASIQKLSRPEALKALSPTAYDYVIVDEVHHAHADSYRRVLDHLAPHFLLGLTATPNRADQGDVLGLFDDFVAYRADLGEGIAADRLVPFEYYGLKDEVDYSPANIPWRNRRFDPAVLEQKVETQSRMEQLWRAWSEHGGTRTLVFCCSIRHARFTREWLAERGVRVEAVHAGEGSADRATALSALERGELDAICSVDLFNEGIDVPRIDRVVMLRPTESPVVFIQQLGRGLRRADGKDHLTVIDFVGSHKVFLNRLRTLLSLAGSKTSVERFVEGGELVDLPEGCRVEIELEAVKLLETLLPRGANELERAYRELKEAREQRPTAGALYRSGYLPSTLRPTYDGWFDFVAKQEDLTEEEARALKKLPSWFESLETTPVTKSFKLVVLEVLLEAGALREGMEVGELARRSHALLSGSTELFRDLEGVKELKDPRHPAPKKWLEYWKKNPIAAWTEAKGKDGRAWFRMEGDRFVPGFELGEGEEDTFASMTRELVDYRLARYRAARRQDDTGDAFECKLTWNQRDPILKLPSRAKRKDLPEGELDVRLPDGASWRFRFMKEFCNVARPVGTDRNELPDLARRWFGMSAGKPGTNFAVRFARSPDGWWVEPVGAKVISLPPRGRVTAFPTLRAAAGASTTERTEAPDAEEVLLPIEGDPTNLFAVRADGDSMDGGKQPIRDGDWVVMTYARGAGLGAVEGKVVLVQTPDEKDGHGYQLKRAVRENGAWVLRSDNPARPSYPATAESVPIAILTKIVKPEELSPQERWEGSEEEFATEFGLEEFPAKTRRMNGHLFIVVRAKDLTAPDRVTVAVPDRRPGETAYVALKTAKKILYAGVGRWSEAEQNWSFPALSYDLWRAQGHGRSCSRTLPETYRQQAEPFVTGLLARHGEGSWIAAGDKTCRITARAPRGGLRIDGGPGGFAERTISLSDFGWALAAIADVEQHGGVLNESRVNRLRYIEGTPKESTRWIDTGWAIHFFNASRYQQQDLP